MLLGGLGCAWALLVLPVAGRNAPIERAGSQIIDGAPYQPELLATLVAPLEDVEASEASRPSVVHGAMLIRLRLLEDAIARGERREIDGRADGLRHSIDRLLKVMPTDAFAWLMLFWVENLTKGYDRDHLKYLRMSYQLGPNEGWIALRRSRLVLGLFDALPPDLAAQAIAEFVSLVDSGFYKDAAAILMGPAWNVRGKILPQLEAVSPLNRQLLDRYMSRQGATVSIPGVDHGPARPWR